jgi:uncharacterized membrane protein (UPF0127 family)
MRQILLMMLLVGLSVSGCRAATLKDHQIVPMTITRANGGEIHLNVEMAIEPETQTIGLMFRKMMADDAGMLFTFPPPETEHIFWMKDTLMPLDMVFIRADGIIRSIHENAIPLDLTPIHSNGPVSAVLEIKGGRARALGLVPGDIVHHPSFHQ